MRIALLGGDLIVIVVVLAVCSPTRVWVMTRTPP
jgi:hypothetical protein